MEDPVTPLNSTREALQLVKMDTDDARFVKVRTTLPARPMPLSSERPHIKTERLVVRPPTQDDLQGLHLLRTQPEVMKFTSAGRIDRDLEETQSKLDMFLPPNDAVNYNFVICLASTGELIGMGGVHKMSYERGWPVLGYMYKRENWGLGYATEFLKAFMEAWWKLPREEVELQVEALSVDGAGQAAEQLRADVDATNMGSLRVMEKSGFRKYGEWTEKDKRPGHEEPDILVIGFVRSSESSGN